MKKSISLVLITLLFVVLGCSLDSFTGKKDEVPTPAPSTDSSPSTSGDKPSDSTSTSSSGPADLSLDKFNQIELDMSYDQVKGIMGSDGNETSSTKSGSYESKAYQWKGDKFAQISVRFQNSKLVSKSQSGITPSSGTADISQAKFNNIKTGMKYEEVKNIIGSDGEMTRLSKFSSFTSKSYTWKGKGFSRIITTFRNDELQNKTQAGLK